MDIKKLIRNASKIHDVLEETVEGSLVAKRMVKIVIPARFVEAGLAFVGAETTIVGIYAIIVDDAYYGISLVNAMIKIEPSSTMKIQIGEESYYEFTFDPGSKVVPDIHLVKSDILVYKIYNEIISKGNIPWYISYSDLGKIFDTAKYHAGANVGGNHEVTELMVSLITRDPKDRRVYYRSTLSTKEDLVKKPPAYISLKSVTYAATNTVNKLAGSYFNDGLVSALVSPADRVERIEVILLR